VEQQTGTRIFQKHGDRRLQASANNTSVI
jgi:hypothetical protein